MRDIEPKGFQTVTYSGICSRPKPSAMSKNFWITPILIDAMTERNYELAKQYFSYTVLRKKLRFILNTIRGY